MNDMDTSSLSDRELLLVVHTNLTNHLRHHDFFLKIALSAALMGAVNFGFGIILILIQLGFWQGK